MTDPSSWQAYGAYGSGYDSQADTSRRGSEQAGGNNGYAYESADSASMPGVPATSPETAYSFSINQQSSRGPAGDGAFGGDFYQVHSIASPVPSTGYAAPTSPQDWPGVSGRAPSGWPTAIAPYQYTLPGYVTDDRLLRINRRLTSCEGQSRSISTRRITGLSRGNLAIQPIQLLHRTSSQLIRLPAIEHVTDIGEIDQAIHRIQIAGSQLIRLTSSPIYLEFYCK